MPNRIEELFAELAESAGGQQQFQMDQQLQQMEAERELHDTDEARNALKIMGILGLLAAPIPGSNTLAARLGLGQAGKPLLNKAYGATGGDFRKFIIPPLSDVGRRLTGRSGALPGRSGARVGTDVVERTGLGRLIFGPLTQLGRSGSRVGTDAVGRNPLPKLKDPVVTKRGPRGPINIEQPPAGPPRPAPSRTTRLSETDREMIKRLLIPPLTQTGQKTRGLDVKNLNRGMFPRSSPYYPKGEGLERLLIPPLTKTGQRVTDQTRWTPKGMSAKERTDIPLSDYALARSTGRLDELLIPPLTKTGQRATQVSAKETARKARVEIKKLNRWKKGHQAKVRRGDDQYQEGMRSGYEPDIKGGEKMMRESRKRIQEIQAKLDELNKLL